MTTLMESSIPPSESYEPTDYHDAISCQDASLWKEAIDAEITALRTKNTWILAELPPDRKAIKCMFVFKCKPGYAGVEPRRKVRLVAKGCSQISGIDFSETFAPVVKLDTFRLVIAFSLKHKRKISLLDVWVAFLNGDLNEEIYMDQPEGYVDSERP